MNGMVAKQENRALYRIVSVAGAILLTACGSNAANDAQATGNGFAAEATGTGAAAPRQKQEEAATDPMPADRIGGNAQDADTADGPASSSAPRDCYLKVDGVVHVDGTCLVFPMGKDSYTLNTWTKGKPANSHFAVVSAGPDGTGTATWNADPDDDRALDPLGTVRKDGDCWTNDRARLCVR